MAELDYRVWYRGGLWFWDVYGSATTPVAQGAALSSVAARAEAMAYAMRASESDGSIESCRLAKETARQGLMDTRDRYNGLKQRIPNLTARTARTSRIIRSARAMIEESSDCSVIGNHMRHCGKSFRRRNKRSFCHEFDSQLEIEAHVDGLGSKLNDSEL